MALSGCRRRTRLRNLQFGLVVLLGLCRPGSDVTLAADDTRRAGRHATASGANVEGASLDYSQIRRDAEPLNENLFRDVRAGGSYAEKLGPADAVVEANAFGPRVNIPLFARGIRPEDAELKFGRFYLDLQALSTSLLYSDNIDQTEDDREDGVIGIVRLTGAVLVQVTDNTRLAVRGTLVYLPFRNAVGVSGFGIDDPMMEFESMPLFQSQLTLDRQVGGWDVEIIDDFRVRQRRYGMGLDAFDGEEFDQDDRAGHYVYRNRTRPPGRESRDDEYYAVEQRNLAGASVGRLLPTATRLEFGGYHANYWYDDTSNEDEADLPNSRDTVYAMLISERETLRFKPFIRYRAWTDNNRDGWSEEVRAGVQGPVTENLHLLADGGPHWRTDTSYTTYVARLRLQHIFNPLTYHQLQYYRGDARPYDELADVVFYRLRHVFRDDLLGEIYCTWAQYEDAQTGEHTGTDRRGGVRFTYDLAQRTTLSLGGAYGDFSNTEPDVDDYREWIGRVVVLHNHSTSVQTRLTYQYRDRMSDTRGESYWENLVVLTVTKSF